MEKIQNGKVLSGEELLKILTMNSDKVKDEFKILSSISDIVAQYEIEYNKSFGKMTVERDYHYDGHLDYSHIYHFAYHNVHLRQEGNSGEYGIIFYEQFQPKVVKPFKVEITKFANS